MTTFFVGLLVGALVMHFGQVKIEARNERRARARAKALPVIDVIESPSPSRQRRRESEQLALDDVADEVLREVSAPRGRRVG